MGYLFTVVYKTGRRDEKAERDHAFRGAEERRMTAERQQFTVSMRFLHWLMAALVLTMLGIGVAMVASLADYHALVSLHRPLGIIILLLVVVHVANHHQKQDDDTQRAMEGNQGVVVGKRCDHGNTNSKHGQDQRGHQPVQEPHRD